MAQKVIGYIKLQIPAGKATPAPPVGPALGQHGVNIMAFTKEFNERTKNDMGMIIPVVITVYADHSFSFVTKTPPAAVRRAALRKLCITGAVTLVLTGLWAYLHAVCLRQYQRGDMVPLAAMLITEPLLLCALAWTLLQALRMVTRLRPRRGAPWVHPLVWALFGLCLAILVVSVVLPAAGVMLPRLYGARSTTAMLFFLLGALLWLTQPDAAP